MSDSSSNYARSSRPKPMRLLAACRLDKRYERGVGDWLSARASDGREVQVLDAVGGFGVGLLGHNNPEVVDALRRALDEQAPFHAQGSERAAAGDLCKRLSELVGAHTGRRYVVTLASTGTEAVEAAIKHAELERRAKVEAFVESCRATHAAIQEKLRNRECDVVPRLLVEADPPLGLAEGTEPDLEEIFHRVLAHNLRLSEAPPVFFALHGAFHGKTTGSVQFTHDAEYRLPFRHLGCEVRFLPRGDLDALRRAIRDTTHTYLDFALDREGIVRIREREFANVGALLLEPIQGEGGVRPLGADYLQGASEVARTCGFPLILDEIQTGCGRTGTFVASEQDGVIGDYYLLSKALGGGLCKVSALLVDSARYHEQFGYVHSSTFADDDLSSRVALAALERLGSPAFLEGVAQRGRALRDELGALAERYPNVIAEVRGRGLMLGVEFASQLDAASPTIRVLSEQKLLGFVLSGYLLNECRVRVLPTLSQPDTLRIQLSGFAGDKEQAHLLEAFQRVCRLLELDRSDELVRFLCAADEWAEPSESPEPAAWWRHSEVERRLPTRPARHEVIPPYAGRVAFMGHFVRPGHLGLWDPALAEFDEEALETYLTRVHRILDPFMSETVNVSSVTGETVQLNAIGVPLTPRLIERAFEEGNVRWVEDKISEGVRLARRCGASIVGLGGYLSILTGQGTRLSQDRIGLTSGNAMTVAMGVEALFVTAEEVGIDPATARLGALGATGNICSLYAQLAADHVPKLSLIGRPGMASRLRVVAEEVYFEVYKAILRGGERARAGLAKDLVETQTFKQVAASPPKRIGAALFEGLALELGDEVPIRICGDPSALLECDLIVGASSAAGPVIFPEHLGAGPRVICDLAVPEDTSPEVFRLRPDVRVIRGGIVRLPNNPDLQLPGVPLEPGCVFACLAETLLLGLSRVGEHFSWGRVTRAHVEAIRDLARYHGFTLERPSMTSVL